ncbi:MAG TPA: VacJ family lipoprotein [Leucothrix sp.]|nr:VacJ family lipoprotein [Leucothrix sp.]
MVLAKNIIKRLLTGLLLTQMLLLVACSNTDTTGNTAESKTTTDQFETLNRSIYKANMAFDKHLLKPVAKAYKTITPEPIDTSITNFFLNLDDISNAANNLLQFKMGDALKDTERFIFNSTFGIAGLLDIATEMGLKKHHEDFGQTLAVWGVDSGPYVMLPLFGSSTLRDATAKFSIDFLLDPTIYSDKKYAFFVLKNLDKRTDLLSAEDAFKDLSDDQYIAIRDAWLQHREYLIHDGKVDEKEQSDLIDELEDLDDDLK